MNVSGKLRDVVLVMALIVSVTGCAAGSSGGGATSDAARVLAHVTPLERQLLINRHVNFSQYNRAVQATVSCLRAGGYTVSSPVPGIDGILEYTASYSFGDKSSKAGPSQKQQNRVNVVENNCDQESAAVQAVYILDHAVSAQQIPRAFSKMVSCFRAAGVSFPSSERLSDLASVMHSVRSFIQTGNLTQTRFNSCQAGFAAAELQPLPGLAQALANMKKP